jgi:hypothetical protein
MHPLPDLLGAFSLRPVSADVEHCDRASTSSCPLPDAR